MNCLIILLLLACGGCQNGCGCGRSVSCGHERHDHEHHCHQEGRDRDDECPCRENPGPVRYQRMSGRADCDCEHDEPAAWREEREGKRNNYPSISGNETCGCDAE